MSQSLSVLEAEYFVVAIILDHGQRQVRLQRIGLDGRNMSGRFRSDIILGNLHLESRSHYLRTTLFSYQI